MKTKLFITAILLGISCSPQQRPRPEKAEEGEQTETERVPADFLEQNNAEQLCQVGTPCKL